MRKSLLAAVAMSALATSFVAPAAQAGGDTVAGPTGPRCGYFAVSNPDPDAPPDSMTGQIYGGPASWDRPFTLTCTLRVNTNGHSGSFAVQESAPSTSNVATLPPTPISYTSGEFDQDYLCTSVTHAGGTYYWSPTSDADGIPPDDHPGHWTTSASEPCAAADQFSTGPIIRLLNELIFEPLDGLVICPVLQIAYGTGLLNGPVIWVDSEGDVFLLGNTEGDLFWDCPEYVDDGDAADGIFDA